MADEEKKEAKVEKPKAEKKPPKRQPVKRCPRCTVKSEAKAKFCVLCGLDIENVPVSK